MGSVSDLETLCDLRDARAPNGFRDCLAGGILVGESSAVLHELPNDLRLLLVSSETTTSASTRRLNR